MKIEPTAMTLSSQPLEPTRIIAVRHGQTTWNQENRIQGHLNIGLNDRGQWQAHQLAAAVVDEAIDVIYSSDLLRAADTAAAIGASTGLKIFLEPGLRERCFGIFEGKTFGETETLWPAQARRMRQREPGFAPDDGGESLVALQARITSVVFRLAARHPGALVLLVTHGGVLDALYRMATGLPIQAPRSWALENAAINRLLWTPQGLTLVGWADTRHLENLESLPMNLLQPEMPPAAFSGPYSNKLTA